MVFVFLCAAAFGAQETPVGAPPARSPALTVPASNVLAAVGAQYAAITNLTCTVRREADDGKGGTMEVMSRVDWARGNRMRVQVLKGGGRRVVIDGESVYVKYPGSDAPKKYKVADQTSTQAANLLSVPASPEEMLAPLASLEASDGTAPAPFARAVAFSSASGEPTATVFLDGEGRVARIDFFGQADDGKPGEKSSVAFRAPIEALPGVWLFRRVETEALVDGAPIATVTRFDRIEANGDLPDAVFDPACNF